MKTTSFKISIMIISLSLFSGCVLIDGQPAVLVSLNEIADTHVKILNAQGKVIHEGTTPIIATMLPSDEYLRKTGYSIVFTTPGYIERSFTINSSSNGTYFEHRPNHRAMGVLVLNSRTGALFQIDKEIIQPDQSGKIAIERRNDFEIYTLNQLPNEWKSHLYLLN